MKDALSGSDVSFRKTMGGYPVYCRGAVIGGIYDDRFLFNMIQMSVSALGEEVRGTLLRGCEAYAEGM
ncbi:MAG: hypothetical protein ACI4CE_06795 [Methanomethylophilus alvi]